MLDLVSYISELLCGVILFGDLFANFFASQIPSFSSATDSSSTATVFRWARIQDNQDYFIPVFVALLLIVFFVRRYGIDAVDLKRWQRFLLLGLRICAIVSLLLVYLHPQWERLVGSSRVAIMIDTSASMGNHDVLQQSGDSQLLSLDAGVSASSEDLSVVPSRIEAVIDWVKRSEIVEKLSERHDVVLYSFDKTVRRISPNQTTQTADDSAKNNADTAAQSVPPASESNSSNADRAVAETNQIRLQLDVLESVKADGEETNIGDALFDVLQLERGRPLAGVVVISDGRQNAGRSTESSLETASRLRIPFYTIGVGASRQPLNFRIVSFDSPERFFPDDPFTIKVPVEFVGGESGEGSESDSGELNSYKIKVELWSQQIGGDSGADVRLDEKEIKFDRNGVVEAEFNTKFSETGKRRLMVKILPPDDDKLPEDNVRHADIEIVDRKDRVLMYSSAPSRDYQFLCSQVFRDKTMSVDVYLPWTRAGIAQNADKILSTFPATQKEMSEYDVVFAFDPDWMDLSTEQIDILEHWVARQGGGLVLFAGSINLANPAGWVSHSGLEKIWAMYPVEFLVRQPSRAFEHNFRSDVKAWPLKFSRFGDDAEFLRPVDNQADARNFWGMFPGFYGYFPVKSVKPTATLLVSSGAPDAIGEMGALFVEQYYGSGRVLYFGSSELWRLRRMGENYYEQLATRLIRHLSQGRLQRDSDRGSVTLDKRRYGLGSIAKLRVTANDDQLKPIILPKLPIDILSPAGKLRTVEVMLDPNAPGIYQGHIPLTEEGTWSVKFNIPSGKQEITRTFQVQMSDLERENPSRNELLLREIAMKSGGIYFGSPPDAMPLVKDSALYGQKNLFELSAKESNNSASKNSESKDLSSNPTDPKIETNKSGDESNNVDIAGVELAGSGKYLTELLQVRSQRAVLDSVVEERMLQIFLILICVFLLLEWTLRRLMKLA
ncbi:MAG: VWA domain-containing protein [Planctomycetaceae bacterium]|jgi:hypothetical protein|nr:VWA domain-containing protein [Planctomycetaceae bacterium]